MWNRSLMPTPSSLVCCPSVATRRTVSPALGCFACSVCSADTISSPWLLVRVRSPLSNEWRSRANSSACCAVQVRRPGVEVRAGEVVVHRASGCSRRSRRSRRPSAGSCGKLARITQVMRHVDDRRHRVGLGAQVVAAGVVDDVRVELGSARALGVARDVEQRRRLAARGSRRSRGWRRRGRDRRVTATGRRTARRCRGRGRRTAAVGPPVTCAVPTLATWNHVAPCAGTGWPTSSQAVVTMPATSSPHTSGATTSSVMARRRAGVRPLVLWRVTWLLPWSRWTRWSWSGCRDRHPRGSRPCCRR